MSKEDLRERIANSFIKSLNENELPWHKMWRSQRPYNAVSQKDYRGINALWLSVQSFEKGYTDPRWCTFKQAKDKGWSVNKGEKGTNVEFWSMYDLKTRKTLSLSEAENIISENPERKDDLRLMSKNYTVFNAEQIKGIPKLAQQETEIDIKVIREQRDTLLQNMGLSFQEGGDKAFYSPSEDKVTMPPENAFKDDYGYMSVLLHECGHATGHESRLNRDLTGGKNSEAYAKEELRAEIASAFTAQALGFKGVENATMDNHKAYIQSWAQVIKDKPGELFAAIKDAEKISDYLIEKGNFKLPEKAAEVEPALDETIANAENVKEKQENRQKAPEWSR